jgi:hypothetical protein
VVSNKIFIHSNEKTLNILIIYSRSNLKQRKTIEDHLFSFKKCLRDSKIYYVNITSTHGLPKYISRIKYDLIILHYTFLAGERFYENELLWLKKIKGLNKLNGFKIAIPQDEMEHTNRLNDLFSDIEVGLICTCFNKDEDIRLAYESSGIKNYIKVFTGYVNEDLANEFKNKTLPFAQRRIDIGYRARKLAPNYGAHAQIKFEVGQVFYDFLKNKNFVVDINSTNTSYYAEGSVKLGDEWFNFLASCKSFLGTEGGASLLDPEGVVKKRVNDYLKRYPEATFDEVEKVCFPDLDGNISLFALSPRHFEAAITKTLQILVEGDYGGVLIPWKHYLPVKRDYSNIEELLNYLKDEKFCQKIVDRCYQDIVESGLYSYDKFVKQIINKALEKNLIIEKNKWYRTKWILFGVLIKMREIKILTIVFVYEKLILPLIKYLVENYPKSHKLYKKIKSAFRLK